MKSNKSHSIQLFALLIFMFLALGLDAQPTGPNPSPTPFGFLEALIVAGAAYGGKAIVKSKKK